MRDRPQNCFVWLGLVGFLAVSTGLAQSVHLIKTQTTQYYGTNNGYGHNGGCEHDGDEHSEDHAPHDSHQCTICLSLLAFAKGFLVEPAPTVAVQYIHFILLPTPRQSTGIEFQANTTPARASPWA